MINRSVNRSVEFWCRWIASWIVSDCIVDCIRLYPIVSWIVSDFIPRSHNSFLFAFVSFLFFSFFLDKETNKITTNKNNKHPIQLQPNNIQHQLQPTTMASLDKTLLQDDQQQTPPANEETNDDLFYDFDQQHHQAPLANEESIDDDLFYDFDQAPSTSPTTPEILSDDINIGEESVSSSHGHDDITIDDEEELGSKFDSDRDHDDPDALECIDESTIVPALAACSSSTEPPTNRFDQLKARYKIARVGGKTVIVEANFRNAVTGHTYMRLHIISEFKKFYQPDFPDKKAMNHWLSTLDRCDQVGFYPGRSVPPHVFNTWRGFTYPIRDDLSADDCLAIITPFTNHICKAWCSNDKELEGYVMKWFAHTIQKPGQPVGVALILRGAEGSGKSIILTTLGSLHGRHFVHLTNQNELTADFNGWVEQAILAFADDGTWGSDRKAAGHLKTIITEPTLRSRRLFQEAESV